MKVPEKLLEKWNAMRSEDDTAKISETAKVSAVTIRIALKTGVCNDEVFKAVADYYEAKGELIKQYL